MKAKEVEKLIRRYVPARTLLGSNREKFIAELQELHQVGVRDFFENHLIDEIHEDADSAEIKQYDKDGEIVAHTSSTNLNLKDAEA